MQELVSIFKRWKQRCVANALYTKINRRSNQIGSIVVGAYIQIEITCIFPRLESNGLFTKCLYQTVWFHIAQVCFCNCVDGFDGCEWPRICKFIEILWHKVRMAREVKLDFGMDDMPGKWCGRVRWVRLPWSAYQHEMLHSSVTVTWHCLAPTKIVGVGIWSIIIYYTMAMRLAAIHCWTMHRNIKLANGYEWF